jgi:hypothetical protein
MESMEAQEWISRCSARLHAQWPRLPRELRDEVAGELMVQPRWRAMEPESAAAGWLSQGVMVDRTADPPGTGTEVPRY